MSKWFIRAVWLIPTLLVNLLLRLALDSVLDTSFKIQLFQFVYFVLAVWLPCIHLPKLYARQPRVRAERIAGAIMAASSGYCAKCGLPDRMTVHLQVWCVYLYFVIMVTGNHPVSQHLSKACINSMYKAYSISHLEESAREGFLVLHAAFLKHLASVNFNPLGSNPVAFAFNEFWLESMTQDRDGIDLFPIVERMENARIYRENLTALEDVLASILN